MVWRFLFGVLLFLASVCGGMVFAAGANEGTIENVMQQARPETMEDPILCGGLVSATDPRFITYYHDVESLTCTLQRYCNAYDLETGVCAGTGCQLVQRSGLPETTILEHCAGGSCRAVVPHASCPFPQERSQYREYTCNASKDDPNGTVQVTCYGGYSFSSLADSSSILPGWNCVTTYNSSPVSGDEPAGQASFLRSTEMPAVLRPGDAPWVQAPGSTLALPSQMLRSIPADSSLESLLLPKMAVENVLPVPLTATTPTPFQIPFPNLLDPIIQILQPPEISFILPREALGLSPERSALLRRVFPDLATTRPSENPITVLTGTTPDALLLAAEFLRSVPLLKIEYVSVPVEVPALSPTELLFLREEWNAWLSAAQEMARTNGITFPPALAERIAENNEVLHSYIALHQTLRQLRSDFPKRLHTLLRLVENANTFFRTEWLAKNATRLEHWYTVLSTQIPILRRELAALALQAGRVRASCLAPACRMNVLPILPDALPWDLPLAKVFSSLPQELQPGVAPPLWDTQHGLRTQASIGTFGQPLPDLTFDFSSLFPGSVVPVPVVEAQLSPIELPVPPLLNAFQLEGQLLEMEQTLPRLRRLHVPLLPVPELVLPDPTQGFFLVPEPPSINMEAWNTLRDATSQLLSALDPESPLAICDASTQPKRFLMHEAEVVYQGRNPAAVRAVRFALSPSSSATGAVMALGVPSAAWEAALPFALSGALMPSINSYSSFWWIENVPLRSERILSDRVTLDVSWGALQQDLLTAIDTWNAQVRFTSIINRQEQTRGDPTVRAHSGLDEKLPSRLP